jgi:hypothetical protein
VLRRRPLMRAAATTAVVAGTATAVSGRVQRRQQGRAQQSADAEAWEQQQAMAAQPPPAPAPAPTPPASAAPGMTEVEQLSQLAALHQQGALTDDEFAAEKAKILAS